MSRRYGLPLDQPPVPSHPPISWAPVRVEPCACGGLISADPTDHRLIVLAVVQHQGTTRHSRWRIAHGFDR